MSILKKLVLLILIFGTSCNTLAATFVDNSLATFNGTFTRTQWSVPNSGLIQTNTAQPGTYTSPVDDTGAIVNWQNLAWVTDKPYGKELPNNNGSDSGYSSGNINMANNLALWHFNEAPGATIFADSSGNSNTANRGTTTITNSTTQNIFNNSLRISNTTGYLATQNGNSVKNQSEISLALWLRTPSTMGATDQIIYDEPVAGSNTITRFTLRIQNARLSLRGSTTDAGPTTTWLNNTTTLTVNTWYHIVAVFNSNTDVHKIYINGTAQSATVALNSFPNTNPFNTPRIARASTGTNNLSTAFIDEMALFSRELTSQEVIDMRDRGNRLRFQIQTCTTPAGCTLANFRGPGGTNATWYSELNSTTPSGPPSFALSTTVTPIRRYVRYRVQFQNFTRLNTLTAILKSVTITYSDPASLAFSIRDSTDTTSDNICDLGRLSTTAVNTCEYRLKVSTSAASGYILQSKTSGNLSNGIDAFSNAISGSAGTGGNDISNTTSGTEKYGVNISPGSITAGTINLASAFNPSVGNSVSYNHITNQTILTASGSNSPSTTDLINTSLVTHNANISAETKPGSYTQNVTYTVIPVF